MDHRTPLQAHTVLDFEGMPCHIGEVIGQGSNAIVYKGWYPDQLDPSHHHHVLIKELFPFHPRQKIQRNDDLQICVEPEAEEFWQTHRSSFLEGNNVHLRLLADHPDLLGANLNSFSRNGTLYSVLGCSGGRSLQLELNRSAQTLRQTVSRMLCLLQALEAFHKSGFLHLDISPDNVMLVGSGSAERAFLIDYNSARPLDSDENPYLSLKAGYTAPEVENGMRSAIGFPSDLYSVAAVFYRCLMGRTLSLEEMLRSAAPDAKDSPLLSDAPQTVRYMVGRILKKGLHPLPAKRYRSIGAMTQAFQELLDRIDCVGVTHWALWENGRRSVEELIRVNPALNYLKDPSRLYPIRLLRDGESLSLDACLQDILSMQGSSLLITARGGMGKTTLLLHTAMARQKRYSPSEPAVFYISLNGWDGSDSHYIHNQILSRLRFKPEENNYSSALHALDQLLRQPLKTRSGEAPAVLLLLDGINEISADPAALLQELGQLASMAGVRILAASRNPMDTLPLKQAELISLDVEDVEAALGSRGLLVPRNPAVMELLRTPLILSIYIRTGDAGKQPEVQDEAQLMQAYLESLLQKQLLSLPENDPERWQTDAALNWILPRIAAQERRTGTALSQQQLLKIMTVCFKQLRRGKLRRIFPQWIGHSQDILGGAQNPEQWLGLLVHRLLWQKMGLLIQDPSGGFRIFHQDFADYLITLDRKTRLKLGRRQLLRSGIGIGIVTAALCLALQANPLLYDYLTVAQHKWGSSGNYARNMFEQIRQEACDYWEDCLSVNDRIFGDLLWVLDCAEEYTQDGSWESLLKARAACSAAIEDLQNIDAPDYPMTMWDQLLLTLSQVDTVWLEYGDVDNNLETARNTLISLNALLENEVYMTATAEAFPALIHSYQESTAAQLRYQSTATNYILLQLDRPSLWQTLPRQYPAIAAYSEEWCDDAQELQARTDSILDHLEADVDGIEQFLAASEEAFQIVQDTVQTGDLTRLSRQVCIPSGITGIFPRPVWLPEVIPGYYREEPVTGVLLPVSCGENMTRPPDGCILSCGAISREDAQSYTMQLDYFGIPYEVLEDETSQSLQILAQGQKGQLSVYWTEAETTLSLTGSVGCLIPELYLAALLSS